MRIVFFTNEFSHPKLPPSGGVGSFLKTMAEAMTMLGHEVHIFGFLKRPMTFEEEGIYYTFIKKYAKQFPLSEFLRSLGGKLNMTSAEQHFLKKERIYLAKQLKSYSQEHEIDIIESFVFNGFTAYWDNTIPLVLRFHGSRGFWHYYLGAKKEEQKIRMEQIAMEGTPHTVAVSKFSAKAVSEIYKVQVDKIIYNGIDTELFKPQNDVEKIEHSIFYFGTLSKAKGVDTLCHTFNQIVSQFPDASLHIIGRGERFWEYLISQVLSKEALERTSYYGPKQQSELPKLLSQASVCVIPSLNENFGLTINEAMALALPVVVSNIPAFNEIVTSNENGCIADSVDDYVSHIKFLFENPKEQQRIANNARVLIENNFTREIMVDKSINYYQQILSRDQ